jgi:hypothetical protein
MTEDVDTCGSSRAARYRELAAALRTLAPSLKSVNARNELYAIARGYEVLAHHAEYSLPGRPAPTVDAHQEVTRAIIELLDLGQHAHGRMVLTAGRGVHAVPVINAHCVPNLRSP